MLNTLLAIKGKDELINDAYHGHHPMRAATDTFILFLDGLDKHKLVASNDMLHVTGGLETDPDNTLMKILGEEVGDGIHEMNPRNQFDLNIWRNHYANHEVSIEGTFSNKLADHLFAFFDAEEFPWTFWREWYQGFLDGKPMDWELQRRVALIDDAIWKVGPEAVAEEIERIRETYEKENAVAADVAEAKPVTENEKSAIAQRVMVNRDALAVSVAGLLEQLADFKERVRGINHLDADFRQELLDFIDQFSGQLEELLSELPMPGDEVDDDKAGKLVLWWRVYKGLMHTKLAHYASPENVTEATVPTGIVLAATGVGALFGAPLAGSVVGGLIANQMKPGQAAKELLKPGKSDVDGT